MLACPGPALLTIAFGFVGPNRPAIPHIARMRTWTIIRSLLIMV